MGIGAILIGIGFILFGIFLVSLIITAGAPVFVLIYALIAIGIGIALIVLNKEEDKELEFR